MSKSGSKIDLMQASDLGIRLAVMMALCTYGGYRLDQWLDSQPLFLLIGTFLGLGGGMWSAVRSVQKLTGAAPGSEPDAASKAASAERDREADADGPA